MRVCDARAWKRHVRANRGLRDFNRDRIRTAVNVLGDSFGAGIVEHLSQDDLMSMDYAAREDGTAMEPVPRFTPKNPDDIISSSDAALNQTAF